ncbi:SdiA-regulated domain-containing protein [Pseudomonas sp. Z1-24]|uniref:SdiA-regulated domain-containing protein n=1 Tax=unclassified Pseudomonas TaxID=196821 RepID=UPI003DA91337
MQLLTMDKSGNVVDRYPLMGFDDTESVAYLGNGRIALSDEELQQWNTITLPTDNLGRQSFWPKRPFLGTVPLKQYSWA